MVPFYTGEYPDFSTYPLVTGDNFDTTIHQQQQNGQSAVLGSGAHAISYASQIPNNSSYPGSQFQPNPDQSKDMMMISRQAWEDTVSETRQAKRERDELRLQVASLRNELYTSRQVQKQLRIERDEAQVSAKSLKKQTTTLAETHKRLRKERNEARIRAAMLSKAFPKDVTITGRNQDPLALLLGQRRTKVDANMVVYENSRMENTHGHGVTRQEETHHRRPRVNQWHGGGEEVIHDSPEDQLDGQAVGHIDEDQQLIDAFLAETGSPEDLSPDNAGFSPRTMAELFQGVDS